ncbi:MAG TPA: hypothetical protein GX707_02405 [Epulopiscium sp.]|nr:hypothetical protein [Candidatus Epulonipiscium sp.]
MSSIIKGQRIRSESILEIENTNAYIALKEVDENLTTDIQEQKEDIRRKMQQVESKANIIIEKATEEAIAKAAVIIKEGQDRVKIESAIVLERAQEEGYQVGYETGYEEGKLEAQSLIEEGNQVVLDANEQKQQLLDEIEPQIIEMIIGICGKLIDEEINHNKDTILLLIRKTLGQVSSDTSEISVKVSPDEYEYVLENKDLIAQGTANPENMQIKTDANLTKGVCVIETPFGSVACNVNEAFSEIKKQMRLICSQK